MQLIGVYHHASAKHLDRYVDEFAFRLNEGNVARHTLDRLDSFIAGVAGKRLTYRELIPVKLANPVWQNSVRVMRLLCPLGVIAAVAVGYLDWSYERYEMMAVAAFCGGVSTVLTWIQWRWFSI